MKLLLYVVATVMHRWTLSILCYLQLEIDPCNEKGGELGDDDFVDDPKELIGKSLYFKLRIPHARGLNTKYDKVGGDLPHCFQWEILELSYHE